MHDAGTNQHNTGNDDQKHSSHLQNPPGCDYTYRALRHTQKQIKLTIKPSKGSKSSKSTQPFIPGSRNQSSPAPWINTAEADRSKVALSCRARLSQTPRTNKRVKG